MLEPACKRTIAFVDGQNLFHSAKEAFGAIYPDYDVQALAAAVCAAKGWALSQVRFTRIHGSFGCGKSHFMNVLGTPWLSGTASEGGFVKLGVGLQILAEHLERLGYKGAGPSAPRRRTRA